MSEGWQVPWEGQMCRKGRLVQSGEIQEHFISPLSGACFLTSGTVACRGV